MKPLRRPDRHALRVGARALVALTLAASVAGCVTLSDGALPASPVAPARPVEVLPSDPLSAELAAHYQRIEDDRVANNLMRTDSGADEGPLTASRLAETYIEIALREEHARGPLGFGGGASSPLRRWQSPVVYVMEFGATVGRARRLQDHTEVGHLVRRLAAASGHPISLAPLGSTQGNFHVLVLSEGERRAIGPRLQVLIPGIDATAVRLITDMPRETFCMVMAFSRDGSAVYSEAVAVIRAEHPDLTRLACYHEELTQGLGLASDSDHARPSIFNDDQEFALLTDHDLLLLRMHYDPRLTPGMSLGRAQRIIFSIASELAAGAS